MVAVIVAVLLPPLLRVSVKAVELADVFWAIVAVAGLLEPCPVVVCETEMEAPVVLLTEA